MEPLGTVSVEDLETPATAEEILAVLAIQTAYRTWRRRREANGKADGRVTKWYNQCIDAKPELGGPTSYNRYFLGPLVHVLIWVERAIQILKREKEAVQKEFKGIQPRRFEDLGDRLATCKCVPFEPNLHTLPNAPDSSTIECTIKIQEQLSPPSEIHRRGEIDKLRQLITELYTLTERLDLGDAEVHRKLGWKGVVQRRKTVFTEPVKPILNTSDLLEF